MKKLLNRFRSTRGIAMELAITVLLISVALSILLVSTAILQTKNRTETVTSMEQELLLSQIGEDFCARVKAGEAPGDIGQSLQVKYGEYEYTFAVETPGEGDSIVTLLVSDGERQTLLWVELTLEGDSAYRITAWK